MPKIKNWSQGTPYKPYKAKWKHDEKDVSVKIKSARKTKASHSMRETPGYSVNSEGELMRYWVAVWRGNKRQRVAGEPTIKKARKAAVNWMRNHPNG